MCLGESTTALGEYPYGPYPFQLEEVLNQRNIGIKFSVINKAIPSINSAYILSHLEENLNQYNPDMVITMMGLNDTDIKYYEGISDSYSLVFNKFRTYRLLRIIWKDVTEKLKKAHLYKPEKDAALTSNISIKSLYAMKQKSSFQYSNAVNKATELGPGDHKRYIDLGQFYLRDGKPKEAEEAFKKAIELNPNKDSSYEGLGHFYNAQGKPKEAEEAFKKAIELNPNKDNSYYEGLGSCYNAQGKLKEAEEAFKKAIELNPNKDSSYEGLGHFYNVQGKLKEAEEAFKKAIEFNPNKDSSYDGLGSCYIAQGKLKEAEEAFKKAIELNSNKDSSYEGLGSCYIAQGKFKEAEETFKKAIELNPNNDSLYEKLQSCYFFQGKLQEAKENFKKAIEHNPYNYQLYIEVARNYKEMGKFIQAEAMLKKVIELESGEVEAYVELMLLYGYYLHKPELANQLFNKIVALDPANVWVQSELGRFCKDRHEYAQAETFLKRAIALSSGADRSEAYFKLGSMYLEQGKYILAEEAFKKAIEADPAREKAYGGLITLYRETDKGSISKYYIEVLNNLRLKYYSPFVRSNYHKLKEILDKRGIKLVCAQYPMRNIEPLKMMFEPQEQEQIIFVDNEKIFEDALKKSSYKEYFIDLFAGDFGHCTGKGHKLIAENIANVILKEVFHR
jgi:superkiller protein 3